MILLCSLWCCVWSVISGFTHSLLNDEVWDMGCYILNNDIGMDFLTLTGIDEWTKTICYGAGLRLKKIWNYLFGYSYDTQPYFSYLKIWNPLIRERHLQKGVHKCVKRQTTSYDVILDFHLFFIFMVIDSKISKMYWVSLNFHFLRLNNQSYCIL